MAPSSSAWPSTPSGIVAGHHQCRAAPARLATKIEIEAELTRFARLGRLPKVMLDPASESHPQVRQRLKAWGTTPVYPLLLQLLDHWDQGTATSEQVPERQVRGGLPVPREPRSLRRSRAS
jgi:hypothetical protein